jgi:hypothetical protein
MTQLLSKLSERRDGGESARPLGASKQIDAILAASPPQTVHKN